MITLLGNLRDKIMPKMIQIHEELFKKLKKNIFIVLEVHNLKIEIVPKLHTSSCSKRNHFFFVVVFLTSLPLQSPHFHHLSLLFQSLSILPQIAPQLHLCP
uniref:Uncharacterized protein n=1 Tax=Spongospora subterranea TaxID=70186 RepID=A0A0H5QM42_9EUKA|eukprot:CRZ02657.1 hypothetical protein [Spongospora subterranea]